MLHQKFHRLLALILCNALILGAVPNTVTAAELYDEHESLLETVSERETETRTNDEIENESATNFESEQNFEPDIESESEQNAEPDTESESEQNFEPDTESESEQNFEPDTESESEQTTESASDFETESIPESSLDLQTVIDAFNALAAKKPLMALLYHTESYRVRQEPSKNSSDIATVNSGHTLYIKSVEIVDDNVWYQAQFGLNGNTYTGYVEAYYLAYSDEDWRNWENDYLANFFAENDISVIIPYAQNDTLDTSDIEAFPSIYQDKLTTLKKLHPNWTFVPMNTGLDFNTVVASEMGDKSLIQNTTSNAEKGWVGKSYGGGWYYATKDAVAHYINPCNFLTENYIFQFEQLTFNNSYHTVAAIQNFLNTTFMKGKLPDDSSKSYAQAFFEIGKNRSLSPIHLASRVYQEQGSGNSPLISGTYKGYEGYYNYFNVGASGKTDQEVIESGLSHAKSQDWNTHYKSLSGGAVTIGNGYILKGQDTLYLEKFNVDGNYHALYTHQYMQNIQAPASEALSTKKMYSGTESLDSAFVFKIPVYKNMAEENKDDPKEDDKKEESFYVLPINDQTYTGNAITPEVQVFDSFLNADGTKKLIELEKGKDYTISYKNNKNANTQNGSAPPTVVIKGKGNYAGTQYAYFNIATKPLTDEDISAQNITTAYSGKLQKPTPVIYRSGKKLSVKKDFTVSYPGTGKNAYIDAGTYPVVIEGAGGYSGKLTLDLKITSDILMSKVKVDKIPNQIYNETLVNEKKGMTPEKLTVTYNGQTLEEGKNYFLSYVNHLSIGTATAYITAKDGSGFSGTKAVAYKIVGAPINKASVDGIVPKIYTGDEKDVLQKNVSLSLDGTKLREDIDYTVSYANTAKAGTATILFKGINGYSGQLKKTYKIAPLELNSSTITMTYTTQDAPNAPISIKKLSQITSPYMKGSTCPNVQLSLNGTPLVKGRDYTITYGNNKQVTTLDLDEKKFPTITVTGKGNFKGRLTGTWKITSSQFDSESDKIRFVLKDVVYENAPDKFKSTITFIDANGAKLSAGKDYDTLVTFTYAEATTVKTADGGSVSRNAGDIVGDLDIPDSGSVIGAKATITGIGAYEGAAVFYDTYRIVNADITKAKVSVKAKTYQNGDAVTLTADDIDITLNKKALEYGKDYTIDTTTYTNNLNKGRATVVLKGLGKNYGGEKKVTFTICSKALVFWKNYSLAFPR